MRPVRIPAHVRFGGGLLTWCARRTAHVARVVETVEDAPRHLLCKSCLAQRKRGAAPRKEARP
jgi:hypothetical protein